jgi:hypothetical protein
MLPGVKRRHARTQASFTVLWRYLRIGPTTGRLARSPDSRSLLRTVWPEIRTFSRPGVILRAVSSAVIIRFRGWIMRKYLFWRCDVTRGLPASTLLIPNVPVWLLFGQVHLLRAITLP